MKKKVILGLLVGGFLLFFIASTWAVDAKRAKLYGHPWGESERVPVIPQTINNSPSTIKFIFIQNALNLPLLINIEKTSRQTSVKTQEPVKNTNNSVKEQNER